MFEEYIEREEHDLLLVVDDENEIVGVTPYYWIEKDNYVSYYQGPYGIDYEKTSSLFLDYIETNYVGYKFYINTAKEHINSRNFFSNNGFIQIEYASLMDLYKFDDLNFANEIYLLDNSNANKFYDYIDGDVSEDTYWNSKRISENLEKFIILGYFNKDIKGHVIGRKGKENIEIIGFTGTHIIKDELFKALISRVSKTNLGSLTLYTEDEYEVKLACKYKFTFTDNNVCFIKYL